MDELVSNFAPPVVGLIVAGAGLLFARHERRKAERLRDGREQVAKPAE